MITSFKSLGQSGGGGGYVLPTATANRLGGVMIGQGINVDSAGTISVSGGGIEVVTELPVSGTDGQVVILVDSATSSTTEYIWSDTPLLEADIDYTESSGDTIASNNNWLVRFRFEDLPNNTKLAIIQEKTYNNYGHFVYENGEIHRYSSDNASAYMASTYLNVLKNQIRCVGVWNGISDNGYNNAMMFWNDEEIVLFANGDYNRRVWFNTDSFYKSGWVKNKTYKIEKNAFYSDYTWYDADYNIIIKHPDFNLYDVTLKINPNGQYSQPFKVYSKNNSAIGPFFAPTTTGQTGYVCVAGNGWAAPTWKNPSTLLNKSTLYGTHSTFIVATDDWKLLDSSANNTFGAGNFYIYNTCDFNEVTEIIDFNDSTDDGEGGMTEPTQELKVSANTDGSYDVFYGTYSDYEGGVYSYTASTHLDTVFSNYEILSEDQTGYVVRMILRPDGLFCYENHSGCVFVNGSYSTFGAGDSVTIGKMTVFANYEDTPSVYLSQDEGV